MTQAGYCTEAQVKLALNSSEITRLADRNRDGSEDTGVITQAILDASYMIHSIAVLSRPEYEALTDLRPATYDPAVYPSLQYLTAQLAADLLRRAFRKDAEQETIANHPSIEWSHMVRMRIAQIYVVT